MSALTSENLARPMVQTRGQRSDYPEWTDDSQGGSGLPLKTMAVVALAVVAAIYLGPDIARYMRIRNM